MSFKSILARSAVVLAATVLPQPLLAAGAAGAAKHGAAPVVITGEIIQAPTREVRFDDLNLATPSGERVLKGRVRRAVRSVCAETAGSILADHSQCLSSARASAEAQTAQALERAREFVANGSTDSSARTISVGAPQ